MVNEKIFKIVNRELGISKKKFEKMVKNKHAELSGLISMDGASYMIAKELGIENLSNKVGED